MKIIFYEIKDSEFDYLSERIPNTIEPAFIKCALNESTYIDEKQKNIDAISIFVASRLTRNVLQKFPNL